MPAPPSDNNGLLVADTTTYPTLKWVAAYRETAGPPRDAVSGVYAEASYFDNNNAVNYNFAGGYPTIDATGYTPKGYNAPCRKFVRGSAGLNWPDRGYYSASVPTGVAAGLGVTMFGVFQPIFTGDSESTTNLVKKSWPFVSSWNYNGSWGLALRVSSVSGNAATAPTALLGFLCSNATESYPSATYALTSGQWYAFAITSPTTNNTLATLRLGNPDTEALITPGGGVNPSANWNSVSNYNNSTALRHMGVNYPITGLQYEGLQGRVAIQGVDERVWDDTIFAAFLADPWFMCRATRTLSGTLVAPGSIVANGLADGSGIEVVCQLPANAAGTLAYQLERSTADLNFTGGAGTLLGSPQASPVLVDTSVPARTMAAYRVRVTDGASTPVYSPVEDRMRMKGTLQALWIGTSLLRQGSPYGYASVLNGTGYQVANLNRGVSGCTIPSWFTGGSRTALMSAVLAEAAYHTPNEVHVELGTNDNLSAANYRLALGPFLESLAAWTATQPGAPPIYLHDSPTRTDSQSGQQLINTYRAINLAFHTTGDSSYPSLVPGVNIFPGDTEAMGVAGRFPTQLNNRYANGLHNGGPYASGSSKAIARLKQLEPVAASAGGGQFIQG